MIFRNMRMKYYEAAGDDGAAGGGNGPAAEVTTAEVEQPTDKSKAITEPVKENTLPADVHPMDQYVEQYAEDKPALSLALGFLKDAGINPTDPAFQMAEVDGDFTLLEALLAQKGLPGSDKMLGILKGEVEAYKASVAEAQAKTEEQVAGILGDVQEEILEWARSNATEDEKEAINSMMDAGGVYAAAAAIMLRENFNATVQPTKPAKSATVNPTTPAGSVPLTASEYAAQVQALAKKFNGDPRGTPEYKALTAKRQQARARGI